jgi:hypothetical protein
MSSLASIAMVFALGDDAPAQQPPGRGRAPRNAPAPRPAAPAPSAARTPSPDAGAAPVAASKPSPVPAGGAEDAGAIVTKTGDGGAQTIRFGELEIEGRLKSPQLVYFLRRVRAEFAAGDLGHRSFMRELSETKKDQSF